MSSRLLRYKSVERHAYRRVSAAIARALRSGHALVSAFLRRGSQSISILIVAHTEEPPRGMRISLFGLSGLLMLTAAVIVLLFAFSGSVGGVRAKVAASSEELGKAQDELDAVKAQTALLASAFKDFQAALGPILQSGGTHSIALPARKASARRRPEAQSLAEIRDELDQSAPVVAEYGAMLIKMDAVKKTVPAIWPISGGIGHISTTFGTNPNPFTGQSYFHTGIDASTYRSGDLLVATSDGKVIFAGIEGGYGRCVIIAHSYGYLTRYGHMERILVHSGQSVKQGQGIGILGNTGVTTAPHTHYEVILGHNYLDPTDYLWSGAHSFPIITGGGSAD